METIENKILTNLKKSGRGTVFFPDKFASYSTSDNIRKALEILKSKEIILHVARGIYCYPKIDKVLGLGMILPSVDDIIHAIAKRDHIKVVPTGLHAQNMLGLSTQIPMNYVFLTNGYAKNLTVLGNIKVKFKQTSSKNISFRNRLAMLITFALKDYGKDHVTQEQIKHIHKLLQKEPEQSVKNDLALMPVWIRNIVMKAYEQE